MTIRKTMLTGLGLAVTLLLVLSACDIDLWINWPGTDPEPDPEPGLSFSLEWTNNGSDSPNLYVTYPAPVDGDTTNGEDGLVNPIDNTPTFTEMYTPISAMGGGDLGFLPDDIGTGPPVEGLATRGTVYFGNLESVRNALGGVAAVERTEVTDASEVIYVRGFPFTSNSFTESTPGGGITGLPLGSYTWVGVMEVYAYATSGKLAYASSDGVNAVLNVFDDGVLLASYELPANTDLQGSSIVRINCFYNAAGLEIYQLVPDIRVIQSTTQIRSVAPGAVIDDSGVIIVRGSAGR